MPRKPAKRKTAARKKPAKKRTARKPAAKKRATRAKRQHKKTATKGRPRYEFDLAEIEAHGRVAATRDEMAALLGVARSVVDDRFANDEAFRVAYEKGAADGKRSVRRAQLEAAVSGNVTAQIWLGKQWLGQKDTQHHEVSVALQRQLTQQDAALLQVMYSAIEKAQRKFPAEVFEAIDETFGWMIDGFKEERERQAKALPAGSRVIDVTASG